MQAKRSAMSRRSAIGVPTISVSLSRGDSGLFLARAVLAFHYDKEAPVAQGPGQSRIHVVLDPRAALSADLRDDVLSALDRRFHVAWCLQLEIGVADVDDPAVGELELLREHLLGELLVREPEVISLDRRLEEAPDHA